MLPVHVPTSDVNSEYGIVVDWHAAERSVVSAGDPLLTIETSKALIEVAAPHSGVLHHLLREGDEVQLVDPVALVFPDQESLDAHVAGDDEARGEQGPAGTAGEVPAPYASAKAVARAAELGVDLATLSVGGLITVKDVEEASAARVAPTPAAPTPAGQLPARRCRPGVQRLLLLGAGRGAQMVLEMLAGSTTQEAAAAVDDDPRTWDGYVSGVPVIGSLQHLPVLAASGLFDAAVICIAASAEVRAGLRAACGAAGLPLANVVDRTARVAGDVQMGEGNVIGAFCHLGTGTRVGHNNLFSAYTSFDHHNVLGSEISTGPGCTTSGVVTIGDGVRMGTGVRVEPNLTVGDGVHIASGAVVLTSVPAHHAVKTRTFTTVVVPRHR